VLPEPKLYRAEDIAVGLAEEFERDVTEEDVLAFARTSGDWNPLHTDPDYARESNYQGRLVHGAFQVGLASALLGMYLPGRHALLGSVNARFVEPLYFPCRVRVRGEVASWHAERRAGQLEVTVQETESGVPVAEIALGFSLHEETRSEATPAAQPAEQPVRSAERGKTVLVTGAAGGLGAVIVRALAEEHRVIALTHRAPLSDGLRGLDSVTEVRADLAGAEWEGRVTDALGDAPLYAVVHAAWPGIPRGGLLEASEDVLERQLAFGTTCVIRLARLLFGRAGKDGGRLVALGSVAGTHQPVLSWAGYSLGKAALESTVRLLAPELARKQITANAVCPSFVPAGVHRQAGELQRKREAARVPLGRLCQPEDVAGLVRYLLSPEAAFLSGQSIGLSGGQL
jgi:3-oxoacyl-[acyl-carrier protein] reductase